MQFSAVENRFIVKSYLNSTFTNDLKRFFFFVENVHSYRLSHFKGISYDIVNLRNTALNIQNMTKSRNSTQLTHTPYIELYVYNLKNIPGY